MHRGMSMIEILVTLAIFALMVGLGLFMSFEAYRGSVHRSERDTIVSLLQRARSRAMANIDQSAWSVCYLDPEYVVARGSTCDASTARERISANAGVVAASNLSAFPTVFDQVTGNSSEATLTVVQGSRSDDIIINDEGTISW